MKPSLRLPASEYSRPVLADFEKVDWAAIAGPEWYRPEQVVPALLALSTDETGDYRVQSRVLFAVGNDHGGELYPAAVAAAPLLLEIALRATRPTAQAMALAVLDNMLSFHGVDPFDVWVTTDGRQLTLNAAVAEAIHAQRTAVETIARSGGSAAAVARSLLGDLDELMSS
jgi:hypothetical protein